MTDRDKVIKGLECCAAYEYKCNDCPYQDDGGAEDDCYSDELYADALALLKAQNEIIDGLIKVGYPHNFQREEPWIINYMYAITDVIRKAVNLRNEHTS